jgi:hypothetical protein
VTFLYDYPLSCYLATISPPPLLSQLLPSLLLAAITFCSAQVCSVMGDSTLWHAEQEYEWQLTWEETAASEYVRRNDEKKYYRSMRYGSWLRHYATSRKVAGSSPEKADFFN